MRLLILGGSGMLGHKLWQVATSSCEAYLTVRGPFRSYACYQLFDPSRIVSPVFAEDFDSIVRAIATVRPAVVVNCIGIVKQAAAAKDPLNSIAINALFPHRVAQVCRAANIRLIHISTDCVFSGLQGNYSESDKPDPEDLYGRSKLLGEVSDDNCLTLRTSIIGRELQGSYGLIEWFLSQGGKQVRGYTRAIFSGFTTHVLAEIIAKVITEHMDLQGLWHVASEPISKYALLSLVKQVYGLDIEIEPDEAVICDRSLNAERFRQATGLIPPNWPDMIERMYRDDTPYTELRRTHAD